MIVLILISLVIIIAALVAIFPQPEPKLRPIRVRATKRSR